VSLRADAYHALHLSAHGSVDSLEDENGSAAQLIDALRRARRQVPLILLSACSGGASGAEALGVGLIRWGPTGLSPCRLRSILNQYTLPDAERQSPLLRSSNADSSDTNRAFGKIVGRGHRHGNFTIIFVLLSPPRSAVETLRPGRPLSLSNESGGAFYINLPSFTIGGPTMEYQEMRRIRQRRQSVWRTM
jgi:hypothetical protein